MADKDFIQKAIKRPGALRKALGAKPGENIPKEKINKKLGQLRKESEGDKKLPEAKKRLMRQLLFAKTLAKLRPKKKRRSLMDATEA